MVTELLGKYLWLVQTLLDAGSGGLTFQEISRRYEDRFDTGAYPRRTFIRHREAVAEVFGIDIVCNRSDNRYYVDEGENAVDGRESVKWLVNTFTVNNLLTLGKERLTGRVSVEDIPSGQKYLSPLMQAMLSGEELLMGYRKYMSRETDIRHIRPYAVKEFEKRWYVVAWSVEASALRVYALDRICTLEKTGETFRMPKGFDVDTLFEASYGIYLPEGEPQLVKLKTTRREAAYLQDLPLHPSQTLLSEEGDSCIFALRVIPNPGFIMELCRHGGRLEVLEPKHLRETVLRELQEAIEQYT